MKEIRDYNGKGMWSRESIERRFISYSKTFGTTVDELKPRIHEKGQIRWIYPLIDAVIDGIEKRDPACIELGIELIEDSESMPFGMILKSNTARALRRVADMLTEDQNSRIRQRVVDMFVTEYMPREFLQYIKLVKAIGAETVISQVETSADLENPWVRRYLEKMRTTST